MNESESRDNHFPSLAEAVEFDQADIDVELLDMQLAITKARNSTGLKRRAALREILEAATLLLRVTRDPLDSN